jgi:hypothetical protein
VSSQWVDTPVFLHGDFIDVEVQGLHRVERNSHYRATPLGREPSGKIVARDSRLCGPHVLCVSGSLRFQRAGDCGLEAGLALADTARGRGELHYAKSLYLQVGRLAASRDDWAGLLAAACGIKKHDRGRGRYSATNMLLLRAMVAAEAGQSRSGMAAVGKAFSALGEDKVASMVLSRIRTNWG